ncbi:MAG: multidrug efflux SMR transporter [Caldilineales bacterium]|nr:multidrug efflux SMR transporter [Caldilineales bacterium]
MVYWFYLLAAIVLEVAGTTSMKLSDGFSKWLPTVSMAVFYIASVGLLTLSLKKIDVGVAYAIWSGIGTALIVTIGVFLFREQFTVVKGIGILLILGGVVILNLSGGGH